MKLPDWRPVHNGREILREGTFQEALTHWNVTDEDTAVRMRAPAFAEELGSRPP